VATFEDRVNASPYALADRLWVKDQLNPEEEKLRFSKQAEFRMSRTAARVAAMSIRGSGATVSVMVAVALA
jgi:hypothetical protein